jgi:DnaK suppressor protein
MNKAKKKAAASKPKSVKKPAAKKPAAKAKPAKAKTVAKPAAKAAPKTVAMAKPAMRALPKPIASKNPKGKDSVSKQTSNRSRLNKEELKFFEKLLNEKKETLIQELDYLEDNTMRLNAKDGAGDLSSHAYHLADHATETQDREQAFHLASREGRYLNYIEEALDRVRAGTYGLCKNCGKLIPKARLEAVPTAKMCIDCKAKQEQAIEAEAPAA